VPNICEPPQKHILVCIALHTLIPVTEPGTHTEEVLSCWRSLHRCSQTKKSMMFNCTLPQMLACLLIMQPAVGKK